MLGWLSRNIDTETEIFISVMLSLASALMMFVMYLSRRNAPGLLTWMISNVAYAVGFAMLLMSFAPNLVTGLLANYAVDAGAALAYVAVCRFLRRPRRALWLLLPAGLIAAVEAALYFHGGVNYRMMVLADCAIRGSLTFGAGWLLLRHASPVLRPASTMSAFFHFLWVAMLAVRAGWWLFAGYQDISVEPTTRLALLVRILLTFIVTPSYLWMVTRELDAELIRQAQQDPLTGISNRRVMWENGQRSLTELARRRRTAALFMIDIDDFKAINDRLGHDAGDIALVRVAETLAGHVRAQDLVARIGGEEFMVLMPDADPESAREAGERLRQTVEEARICLADGTLVRCTVSIGYSLFGRDGSSWSELVSAADRALYAAKGAGRNRSLAATAAQAGPVG